jgi:hypothetical protein
MKLFFISLLYLFVSSFNCYSNELSNVVSTLDVDDEQFRYFWGISCDPDWQLQESVSILKNKKSLVPIGIRTKFISAEISNDTVILKSGPVCEALLEYFFTGQSNNQIIKGFLQRDSKFKSKFNFSVLDAWVTKYPNGSMNGEINLYKLKLWQQAEMKGLIKITEKESIFNGSPSRAYLMESTMLGNTLRNEIKFSPKTDTN